jgi:hypothetical protein
MSNFNNNITAVNCPSVTIESYFNLVMAVLAFITSTITVAFQYWHQSNTVPKMRAKIENMHQSIKDLTPPNSSNSSAQSDPLQIVI